MPLLDYSSEEIIEDMHNTVCCVFWKKKPVYNFYSREFKRIKWPLQSTAQSSNRKIQIRVRVDITSRLLLKLPLRQNFGNKNLLYYVNFLFMRNCLLRYDAWSKTHVSCKKYLFINSRRYSRMKKHFYEVLHTVKIFVVETDPTVTFTFRSSVNRLCFSDHLIIDTISMLFKHIHKPIVTCCGWSCFPRCCQHLHWKDIFVVFIYPKVKWKTIGAICCNSVIRTIYLQRSCQLWTFFKCAARSATYLFMCIFYMSHISWCAFFILELLYCKKNLSTLRKGFKFKIMYHSYSCGLWSWVQLDIERVRDKV